jgi:uncharacterized protein (DUF983 family)
MIKCPHCGKEFEENSRKNTAWYYSDISVIIGLLCFGPFALRLVWSNPRYKPIVKWIITILIIAVTIFVAMKCYSIMQATARQIRELGIG